MPPKKLRFKCKICDKVVPITLTDEFKEEFTKNADRYPYPLIYPHAGHWAVIYLDEDFRERGIVVSNMMLEGEK